MEVIEIFIDYVIEQWVNGDRFIWNYFGINGLWINNNLEVWYGKLKRMVLYVYLNIYIVIKIFKDIQNVEDILRIQRRVGGIVCLLFKKYVIIKMRLQMLKERY